MLVPACDRQRYEQYYSVKGHRNCHDNFLEAMDLNPVGGQGITDLEIVVADTEEEIRRVLK